MPCNELITIAASANASGLLATFITISYQKRHVKKQFKLSVLSDILGYKWQLSTNQTKDELSTALNRVYIAFNDNADVLIAFNKVMEARETNNPLAQEYFVEFLKTMCNASGINLKSITDSQLTKFLH